MLDYNRKSDYNIVNERILMGGCINMDCENCDYKEMYFMLLRSTEKAINLLIKAHQECEDLYLSATMNEKPEVKTVIKLCSIRGNE